MFVNFPLLSLKSLDSLWRAIDIDNKAMRLAVEALPSPLVKKLLLTHSLERVDGIASRLPTTDRAAVIGPWSNISSRLYVGVAASAPQETHQEVVPATSMAVRSEVLLWFPSSNSKILPFGSSMLVVPAVTGDATDSGAFIALMSCADCRDLLSES